MKKFTLHLNESVELSETVENKEVKRELIELISHNFPEKEMNKEQLNGFIDTYSNGDSVINKLNNDSDVYEFYLKFSNSIDKILSDANYFDEAPSKNGISGVYDYLVAATKTSIKLILESLKKDIPSQV